MARDYVSNPLKWLPTRAGNIVCMLGSSAWAWGSWVQVAASAPADMIIAAASFYREFGEIELQVGVGAAGAEVPVVVLNGSGTAFYGGASGQGYQRLRMPYHFVAAGSRIAVRARGTATYIYASVSLGYYERPIVGNLTTTTKCATWTRVNATITNSWTPGAWVEVLASALTDLVVGDMTAFEATAGGSSGTFLVELGIGVAGAEEVVAGSRETGSSAFYVGMAENVTAGLLRRITAGSRLAVRLTGGQASNAYAASVGVATIEAEA